MNRKSFLSLNFLNLFKFNPDTNKSAYNKISEDLYESYDINTGEHITFSKVNTSFNGQVIGNNNCDGVIYVKIGKSFFKRNFYGPVNIRWFGARGDGLSDDTNSFKSAISLFSTATYQVGGGSIYIPAGNYKITSTLIVSFSQLKIIGAGIDLTFIEPTGNFDYAFQYCGSSFNRWLNAVELRNITIKGKLFMGSALKVEYVGLRSLFENINIFNCGNKGIYCKGVFDHTYRNIEIRGCNNCGIHVYEQNKRTSPDLSFEENSFLIFDNIRPIANNKNGIQWLIQGGDSFRIINCKPSEGLVGLRLDSLSNRFEISGLYIDGFGTESTGIQIDDEYTRSISIENLSVFRVKYAVEVINGRGISINHVQVENDNNVHMGKTVYVHPGCVGGVFYNGYNDTYSNNFIDQSNSKLSLPLSFIGNLNSDGKIEKPLTAKFQTMTVKVILKEKSFVSEAVSVNLTKLFKQIYYVGSNIDYTNLLIDAKLPSIIVCSTIQNLNSINIVVKVLNSKHTLTNNIVVDVQLIIVGDAIIT